MPSDDDEHSQPACHTQLSAEDFRAPREHELREFEPCGFCFQSVSIGDVDEADLLVASTSSRRRIHRHDRTGELDWRPSASSSRDLARALADPDVTDPSDPAVQDALGGGD